MSDAKQNDSDRALAKLLAGALQRPGDAPGDSACPDAELLAAYAEHNLDAAETSQWEEHFAGCARCQKILAVLTVSGEEPLSVGEVQRFGRLVATAGAGAAGTGPHPAEKHKEKERDRNKVAVFARPRTAWRWLAPAVGIAAAAALWIALRPGPPSGTPVITAQKAADQSSAPPSALDKDGGSLMARANVPEPPAAAERAAEPQQLKSLAPVQPQAKQRARTASATEASPQALPEGGGAASTSTLQAQREVQEAAPAAKSPQAPEARVSEAAPAAARAAAPSSAPAPAAAGAATDAVGAQAAAPASAAETKPAENKAAENRPLQGFAARGTVSALADRALVVVAAPYRSALWRLSPGGRIEHSIDQGRTWQPQSSGVTSDLLAAAAPSDKVAWIAGRAGVILRTTDGERWQRVASPAAPIDWTGIEASDALHATVTSADHRRFASEDGGQTWKQQ